MVGVGRGLVGLGFGEGASIVSCGKKQATLRSERERKGRLVKRRFAADYMLAGNDAALRDALQVTQLFSPRNT